MAHSRALRLLHSHWCIFQTYAESQYPLINQLLNPTAEVDVSGKRKTSYCLIEPNGAIKKEKPFKDAVSGSVLEITINYPMVKDDAEDWENCNYVDGMTTIGNWIDNMNANPNIKSALIVWNCPGATVEGTYIFANKIKNSRKPIVSFIDEMACSGALWACSGSKEVIASNPLALVGSVGTILSMVNMRKFYEAQGVVFSDIVSSQTPDKNQDVRDIYNGEYDNYRKTMLDPVTELFIKHIKACRPNVTDDLLTGKVYNAQDVVGTFIDSIGSYEYALGRAKTLSNNVYEIY